MTPGVVEVGLNGGLIFSRIPFPEILRFQVSVFRFQERSYFPDTRHLKPGASKWNKSRMKNSCRYRMIFITPGHSQSKVRSTAFFQSS